MSEDTPQHELDAPPWLRVESTLMATAGSIRDAYDKAVAPLGLNLTSASLLAYVAEHGSHTQTGLAERLGIGRAGAGTIIDQLEERALVRRTADTTDRRVWLVEISEQGVELADEIADIDRSVRERLRRGISRSDRQHLASLLMQIQSNLTR